MFFSFLFWAGVEDVLAFCFVVVVVLVFQCFYFVVVYPHISLFWFQSLRLLFISLAIGGKGGFGK